MGKDRFFSFALLGDYLIVNTEKSSGDHEIKAVNLKTKKETSLQSGGESYGYTAQFSDRVSYIINSKDQDKAEIGLIK